MNTVNPASQSMHEAMLLDRAQTLDGQAIDELSSGTRLSGPGSDPGAAAISDSLGASNDRLGAAATNVQNALSYTQATSSDLSIIGSILSRMGQLTAETGDPTKQPADIANYQTEFKALQGQLRAMIGGTSAQIGGSTVALPTASYQGDALFGATAAGGTSVEIGDGPSDQLVIPDTNLRSGATLALIQQDASGAFAASATDPGAAAAVAAAVAQVSTGQTAIAGIEGRLTMAATTIQDQQTTNTATIAAISDVDIAQVSTQLASYNILMQSAAAMLAQSNQDPQAVLKLLRH